MTSKPLKWIALSALLLYLQDCNAWTGAFHSGSESIMSIRMPVAGARAFATAEDDDMTTSAYIWTLVPLGILIPYLLWIGYISNRNRRERMLNWRRSDTRGAKLFRVMFPRLDWDPLYFPKAPHTWQDALGVAGILTVLILIAVSIGLWGDKAAWMQFRNPTPVMQIITLAEILIIFLAPFHYRRYWPKALTKELIEELYRPQIERLREIATHFRRNKDELDQAGQGVISNEDDFKLFSIPSIFLAVVEPRSPNERQSIGGAYGHSLAPHAQTIVATSHFPASNPQLSEEDTSLIPGWVKFSDSSRRSSVIYKAALIDDKGEKRRFELILNLKAVINQIPASPHSTRCP